MVFSSDFLPQSPLSCFWVWRGFWRFIFIFFKFIYFEGEREQAGKRQTEREKRIPSRLLAVSTEPNAGLDVANCETVTWAKIKSQTLNLLSHPGAPEDLFLKLLTIFLNVWSRELRGLFTLPSSLAASKLILLRDYNELVSRWFTSQETGTQKGKWWLNQVLNQEDCECPLNEGRCIFERSGAHKPGFTWQRRAHGMEQSSIISVFGDRYPRLCVPVLTPVLLRFSTRWDWRPQHSWAAPQAIVRVLFWVLTLCVLAG